MLAIYICVVRLLHTLLSLCPTFLWTCLLIPAHTEWLRKGEDDQDTSQTSPCLSSLRIPQRMRSTEPRSRHCLILTYIYSGTGQSPADGGHETRPMTVRYRDHVTKHRWRRPRTILSAGLKRATRGGIADGQSHRS